MRGITVVQPFAAVGTRTGRVCIVSRSAHAAWRSARQSRQSVAVKAENNQKTTEVEEELPPWVRREQERKLAEQQGGMELPFGVYLLASAIVAIAAVGSIFEWTNKNAIFGVVGPDNLLYTPVLGFFALTGVPTAGWLFFKAVESANKAAERMDSMDGFK